MTTFFPDSKPATPHTTFSHNLFIYPTHINLSNLLPKYGKRKNKKEKKKKKVQKRKKSETKEKLMKPKKKNKKMKKQKPFLIFFERTMQTRST